MASGDSDSPQRRSLPPTAPASPVCPGDKPILPSDLMNLNDAEMVKLFEPGQQNGLFERYYQDVRGMITSSSSLSLANESLESLIQDLDELSQPELSVPVVSCSSSSLRGSALEKETTLPSESEVSSTNVASNEINSHASDVPHCSVVECTTNMTSVAVEETQLVLLKHSQRNIPVTKGNTLSLETLTDVSKEADVVDSTVLLENTSEEADNPSGGSGCRVSKRQFEECGDGAVVPLTFSTVPFKVRKVAEMTSISKANLFSIKMMKSCELGVQSTPLELKNVDIQAKSAHKDVRVETKISVKSLSEYFENFLVNEEPESMASQVCVEGNTEIVEEVIRVVEKVVREVASAVKSSSSDCTAMIHFSEQHCHNSETEKDSTAAPPDADMDHGQSTTCIEPKNKNNCSLETGIVKSHKCNKCSFKFARLVNLSRHMSSHTQKQAFCCDSCDLIFNSSEDLMVHNTKLHDYSDGYVCKICNVKVATHPELEEHVGSHLNQEPFHCGECNSKFKILSEFCLHSSQHTGERVFKCVTCMSLFRSEGDLHTHESLSHPTATETNEDKFQCEICGELFEKLEALNWHSSEVHGSAQPTCATCGKSFPELKNLRMHCLRTHIKQFAHQKKQTAPEKKQSPPLSEKKQSLPEKEQSLPKKKRSPPEKMQSVPEKKQPPPEKKQPQFECSECEKHFHTSAVYLRHMSSHKKARRSSLKAKFKIKVSSLSFKEDNFSCDICFAPFSRAAELKKHITSMHVCEDKKYGKIAKNSHTTSLRKQHVNLRGPIHESSYLMQDCGEIVLESNNNAIQVKREATYSKQPDAGQTVHGPHLLILCNPYDDSEFCSTVSGSSENEHLIDHFCSQCSMSFNNHTDFIQHKQLHPLPLQCFVCESSFLVEKDLYSHTCITSN